MRAARAAVTVVFVVHGAVFGTWAARIPAVRADLSLTDGQLGLALLSLALGSFGGLPLAAWTTGRQGSRATARIAIILFAALLPLAALAPGRASLAAALFCFGVAGAAADVAMNAHGLAVEGRYPRAIFSSLHAGWSFGGLAGAAVAGVVARAGVGVDAHFAVAAAVLAVAGVAASARLLPAEVDRPDEPAPLRLPPRRLLPLAALAFCVLFGEAAAHDWSAVYVAGPLGGSEGVAAFTFAAFATTMTAFRLAGDRLTARLGAVTMTRAGGLLAAGGVALPLVVREPAAAVAGFALVGVGLAGIVPILFRTAGSLPGIPPGHGLAALTTVGYGAFVVGPPAVGFLADAIGLGGALWLVVALLATTPALASPRRLPPRP
ncbi:MAG: MFS transporter [Gaiellaceae bacterium]